MQSILRSIVYLAGMIACVMLTTAFYTKHKMYEEIETTLLASTDIHTLIGKFQKASLHSDADCASDNMCYLRFKVQGEQACVYAKAQVYESFPMYRLISVSPETYMSTHIDNLGQRSTSIETFRC